MSDPRSQATHTASGEPLGDVAKTVLFENEVVGVWEMRLGPGEASDGGNE